MLDLREIRARAEEFRREARRGYDTAPMKSVLADLVTPLMRLIDAMESGSANRWLTLEEVMTLTGLSRKYYDKPLVSLGGRSRLEEWQAAGRAVKARPGIWLIHPAQVPPAKRGYNPPVEIAGADQMRPAQEAPQRPSVLTEEDIVDDLLS